MIDPVSTPSPSSPPPPHRHPLSLCWIRSGWAGLRDRVPRRRAESWQPCRADPAHIARCRAFLQQAAAVGAGDVGAFIPVLPPAGGEPGSGPTPYTTGLGLPLSRALARAGNGWLGLDDLELAPRGVSAAAPPSLPAVSGTDAAAPTAAATVPGPAVALAAEGSTAAGPRGVTTFWCVLEAGDLPADAGGPAAAEQASSVGPPSRGSARGAGTSRVSPAVSVVVDLDLEGPAVFGRWRVPPRPQR